MTIYRIASKERTLNIAISNYREAAPKLADKLVLEMFRIPDYFWGAVDSGSEVFLL